MKLRYRWFGIGFLLWALPLFGFEVNRDTLDNGLLILSVEDHKLPVVQIRAVVRAGSALDPKGKEGLASLTAEMLLRGTETRSGPELSQAIEFLGGELRAGTDEDCSYLMARALSRDLELILEIISDALLNPTFPDSELQRAKAEAISKIIRLEDEPFAVVSKEFHKLLYQDRPYGHPVSGYQESVEGIERPDLLEFYNTWFRPNNALLVVVGDVERVALIELISKQFGNWEPGELPEVRFPDPPTRSRPRVKLIRRDLSQAYILLGHEGIAWSDPDLFPTRLMAYILGSSGLTSRIAREIREERGLAYIAYAWFDRRLHPGPFLAELQTKPESAQEAITALLAEISRMKDLGITPEELADARRYYIGHFPLEFDSISEILRMVQLIELNHLPPDYLETYPDKLKALTVAQINRAAREYLHPDRYCLVILGDLSQDDLSLGDVEWVE